MEVWLLVSLSVAGAASVALVWARSRRQEKPIDPWLMNAQRSVDARISMRYVDSKGEKSDRWVRAKRFGEFGGALYIFGFCELRQANRTFRVDRVKAARDETGRRIPDLAAYLSDLYLASPERTKDELAEEHLDVLRVLLYVAKADGRLAAAEKAIIREVCKVLARDDRLTDAMIDKMLRDLSVPSTRAFQLAASRIAKRDAALLGVVADAAVRMVGTQKTVHPDEQQALDYLDKKRPRA